MSDRMAYTIKWTGDIPTITTHYHRCEKCGQNAVNFIEIYNPRGRSSRTVYLCDSCQTRLCAHIDLYLRGDKE